MCTCECVCVCVCVYGEDACLQAFRMCGRRSSRCCSACPSRSVQAVYVEVDRSTASLRVTRCARVPRPYGLPTPTPAAPTTLCEGLGINKTKRLLPPNASEGEEPASGLASEENEPQSSHMNACASRAHTHACTHARTNARTRACTHACVHLCMYACMHVCMHVCMHAYMYVYGLVRACMHACMYACM